VQNATSWRAPAGVKKTVVENIELDEDEQLLVAHVRSRKRGRAGAVGVSGDRGEQVAWLAPSVRRAR